MKTLRDFGIIRTAALKPQLRPAGINDNTNAIKELYRQAKDRHADLVVTGELSLTAYTAADLFYQDQLLDQVNGKLEELSALTAGGPLLIVGAPITHEDRLFNCAAVLGNGTILGVVPKTYLPNSREFYEKRWFSPARESCSGLMRINGENVPFGTDLLFQSEMHNAFRFGIEICEDLWAPIPPSSFQAVSGARLLINLSASNELVGKAAYRRDLVVQQSARTLSAYLYVSNGLGESTTDVVYGGHTLAAQNGRLIRESSRFEHDNSIVFSDFDLDYLGHERRQASSFSDSPKKEFRSILFKDSQSADSDSYEIAPDPHPFVPSDPVKREERCEEILSIQSCGLASRMKAIGCKDTVVGLSGGLDSTLALLVMLEAYKQLDLPLSGIHAYTMPGFGTTERTLGNVVQLGKEYGLDLKTVDIRDMSKAQLEALEHSGRPEDTAYENVQARLRTAILMNKANMVGGLVVGTGDLSELALGWCTYNGDHMSMYAVNSGVPKTLVKYLVGFYADHRSTSAVKALLNDIINTPISPELLPPDAKGKIAQKTEDTIGPYELHDFFLYHLIRCGQAPLKTEFLANKAFKDNYSSAEIRKWLKVFIRRFFSQQFKRSCLPDGPKVGTLALSPRGDWRMPSDATASLWLKDL